jgi:hypothetical protein
MIGVPNQQERESMIRVAAVVALIVSGFAFADKHVNGYVKTDGTYVAPHYRTESNATKNDNYSTKGNTNPYTNEKGTREGDAYKLPSADEPKPAK